ncbi:hypothetical protein [Methylobacterium sp. 22177]|uniref:hypothetical protein n=1 Tax=Methylobacterium sp. 22177 TaxID=3453885 RepID=UPI003F833FF8
MAGDDGFLTRAEARLEELGPEISERFRLALEEAFALGVIAEANGDTAMANAAADMVETIGAFLDLRDSRSGRATADADSA